MKITIEISDRLLKKAKRLASKQGVTLRSFTEGGLRKVIEERSAKNQYKAQPVTFKGSGLSKEFRGASWDTIRGVAYENRKL
jgi:hypothetical protein